jgi:hypothetical protein
MGEKLLIFSGYDRLQDIRGNFFNWPPGIQAYVLPGVAFYPA